MTDINDVDIRLVDGTVLLVFLGLMQHKKATLVAEELGLTQPAISHSIKRLRTLYRDPLFLRKAQGLEPTALARELEPKIRSAVDTLSNSLGQSDAFDPATSDVRLRIGGFDYELATLMPQMIAYAAGVGPNINITTLSVSSDEALEALVQSRIDLGIGFFESLPGGGNLGPFLAQNLYRETYVLIARKGHPLFQDQVTLDRYVGAPHLLITHTGVQKGQVDFALDALGLGRNVQATVPMFFPALTVLEMSDLIATIPRKVAETYAARFGLQFAPLPFQSPTLAIRAVWHQRDASSKVHQWLVDQLRSFHQGGGAVVDQVSPQPEL